MFYNVVRNIVIFLFLLVGVPASSLTILGDFFPFPCIISHFAVLLCLRTGWRQNSLYKFTETGLYIQFLFAALFRGQAFLGKNALACMGQGSDPPHSGVHTAYFMYTDSEMEKVQKCPNVDLC